MGKVLEIGKTAWRIARADRVAFLVDGESYYRAVALALASARHSVFLVGWDVHSRIRLLRGDERDDLPRSLGRRLAKLLARHRGLHVYVLDWDYPLLFAAERESRSRLLTGWPVSSRFHLRYDSAHPSGASHHQKLVLIDDSLAFGGGMDIGLGRWDSSEHLAEDPRRSDPGFAGYVPAHDVMMMADGDVASAVGELVRQRWKNATGSEAAPRRLDTRHDCWPPDVRADLEDVKIGISRTQPAFGEQEPVHEVEALHLAAIRTAVRRIYIENQYLTSDAVAGALAARLQQEDGPEIVIVLPQNNFGWFESRTIQVMHFRSIRYLRQMDRHRRLRICYPLVPGIGDKQVNLHSKVIVVDDALVRIGSSNMTNRSMRLDTECDFSIEADGDARICEAIAAFRDRLLGEHLCMDRAEVGQRLAAGASMTALVDARIEESRCLASVEPDASQLVPDIGDGKFIDPKEPLTAEVVIETFAQPVVRRRAKARLGRVAAMLVALVALAAVWRWTPLHDFADPAALAAWGTRLHESTFGPVDAVALYVLASLLALPVTVLIVATSLVFGPWLGIAYSLVGSLASGLLMFSLGRLMGRSAVEQLTGRHYRKLADGMRERGLLTMIALRLLPVAPFTVVNLVLGVTAIRTRDFALGTLLGMLPGTVGLSLFQSQLAEVMHEPQAKNLVALTAVSVTFVALIFWLRQRLRVARPPRRQRHAAPTASTSTSAISGL